MLQTFQPADCLIASGSTTSLRQFAQESFAAAGLDLADHLESLDALKRPADLSYLAMNPSHIQEKLGWETKRPNREAMEIMYADPLI
jgi:GDPmannose 4,6-dehydratase